ncbi:LOW QUALITY PROTEIN: hypothetical protein CFOL_v3_04061, partial [Cephalotus follicularis]
LQNHESRPTGSTPSPEVNATSSHYGGRGRGRGLGRGRGRGWKKSKFLGTTSLHACRTAKHWVDLYQASLKEKDKRIETNFIGHCDPLETTQSDVGSMGITHLDIADFVTDSNEKMNQVIVDEN